MKNELRVRPLLKYEVEYTVSINQSDVLHKDTFTADDQEYDGRRTMFYRTGNIVREYHVPLTKIIISPVDDEDLADISE